MQKAYRGGLCAFLPFYKGRGVLAEQQKPPTQHGAENKFSMHRHIHMHKKLHSAMLRMWRNCLFAQESGAEKQLRTQNRTQPSSRLVAAKKTPHPEEKKTVYWRLFSIFKYSSCTVLPVAATTIKLPSGSKSSGKPITQFPFEL
jgi:hypothetical protein